MSAIDIVARLLDALKAKDELLGRYLFGRLPSERLLGRLKLARIARDEAKAWLLAARGDA